MRRFIAIVFSLILVTISSQRNDYLQFLTYTRNISRFNSQQWSSGFDQCISLSNIHSSGWCLTELQQKIRGNLNLHWISPSDRRLPNCHYKVSQVPTSSDLIFLHLRVIQYDCLVKSIQETYPGGSSFYVLAEGLYQQVCEVLDSQDSSYDIICFHQPPFMHRLAVASKSGDKFEKKAYNDSLIVSFLSQGFHYHHNLWLERNHFCQRITIILDFEHYDAFSEFGAFIKRPFPLLRYSIVDRQVFCASDGVPVSPETDRILSEVDSLLEEDGMISNEITSGCWRLNETLVTKTNVANGSIENLFVSKDYEWRWETEFNPLFSRRNFSTDIPSLLRKFTSNTPAHEIPDYWFLGESHLRFLKDYLIGMIDENELKRIDIKHMHYEYDNIRFRYSVYNHNLEKAILAQCNAATQRFSIIAQTGAWDLAFSFISHTLEYRDAAPSLMYLFKDLIAPTSSEQSSSPLWLEGAMKDLNVRSKRWISFLIEDNCRKNLQDVIWLDVMPYPCCEPRDLIVSKGEAASCVESRKGRNNYNIQAMSYFYERSLIDFERQRRSEPDPHPQPQTMQRSKIHFLQTRKIFLPRLVSASFSNAHFMTRDDHSPTVITGEEGVVFAQALVRLLHYLRD